MNNAQNALWKESHTLRKKLILIADADAAFGAALAQAIREETPYFAFPLQSGLQVLNAVKVVKPDMILLGDQLPDMKSMEVSKQIHSRRRLEHVPVLFLYLHSCFSPHGDEQYRLKRAEKLPRLESLFDVLQERLA